MVERGDVRDHIDSSKSTRTSVVALKATQQQRSLKINFRETFRVVRFSTFATISAISDHSSAQNTSGLSATIKRALNIIEDGAEATGHHQISGIYN